MNGTPDYATPAPQVWQPTATPPPPGYYLQHPYPVVGAMPSVPSLTLTVVITAFFGLFGMIPAHTDGKRARALGVPSSRYWKAFGLTFCIAVAVHVLIWALLSVSLMSVERSAAATSTTGVGVTTQVNEKPTLAAPEQPDPVTGLWSATRIEPVLARHVDEDAEDWAAFSHTVVVVVPCGGEGANGAAPDLIQSTTGGKLYLASAELLASAARAQTEIQRLSGLLAGCVGPYDYLDASDGSVLTHCEAPIVASLGPVIRYEELCDLDPGIPISFAIFQSNNAVVALMAPSSGAMDMMLPSVMADLQVG